MINHQVIKIFLAPIFLIFGLLLNSYEVFGASVNPNSMLNSSGIYFDLGNNLVNLDFLLISDEKRNNYLRKADFYPVLLGRESWNLQIPILNSSQNIGMGLAVRKVAWYRATGDTLEFYQESQLNDSPAITSNYELGYWNQKYTQLGIYVLKEFLSKQYKGLSLIARGDLFAVTDFEVLEIEGQGTILQDDSDGSRKSIIDCKYLQSNSKQIGWGASGSIEIEYTFNSKSRINVCIKNLISCIYLPDYYQENGKVDSLKKSIGPVYMSGSWIEGHSLEKFPIEIVAETTYPFYKGNLFLRFNSLGMNQDYLLGYSRVFNNEYGIEVWINPQMDNVGLGCGWRKSKINVISNLKTFDIKGLVFQVCF